MYRIIKSPRSARGASAFFFVQRASVALLLHVAYTRAAQIRDLAGPTAEQQIDGNSGVVPRLG
jgi:hypothetical protein